MECRLRRDLDDDLWNTWLALHTEDEGPVEPKAAPKAAPAALPEAVPPPALPKVAAPAAAQPKPIAPPAQPAVRDMEMHIGDPDFDEDHGIFDSDEYDDD